MYHMEWSNSLFKTQYLGEKLRLNNTYVIKRSRFVMKLDSNCYTSVILPCYFGCTKKKQRG